MSDVSHLVDRDDGISDDDRQAVTNLLRSHRGWEVVQELVEAEAAMLRDQILLGTLDADTYRLYAGRLQGLLRANEIAESISDKPPGGPE